MKLLLFLIIVFLLAGWAPWQTAQKSEQAVAEKFDSQWNGVADGCGRVRFENTRDVAFGYRMDLLYLCGANAADAEPRRAEVYVSPVYSVHWVRGYEATDEYISRYFRRQ